MSGPIFCQLFSYVTTITINILILDRSMSESGGNLLTLGLNALVAQTAYTWTLCYYASEMSAKINLFALETYASAWYNCTVAEQRIICMILTFGQQEVRFSGFGIIYCSLQTFVTVHYAFDFTRHKTLRFSHTFCVYFVAAFTIGHVILPDSAAH